MPIKKIIIFFLLFHFPSCAIAQEDNKLLNTLKQFEISSGRNSLANTNVTFYDRSKSEQDLIKDKFTFIYDKDNWLEKSGWQHVFSGLSATNLGQGDTWYLVPVKHQNRKSVVNVFDVKVKQLLETVEYSLDWPYQYISKEFLAQWDEREQEEGRYKFNGINDGACIEERPMYGDIDGDGHPEIVFFKWGKIDILSLHHKRLIFSEKIIQSDWIDPHMIRDYHIGIEGAQYVAASGPDRYTYNPALRSYSKMYINDFDQDGNQDIVTWRKTYKTNKAGEEKGFHKISETFLHYEFDAKAQAKLPAGVTGDFLPQSTSAEKIQSWIKPSLETWQSGYPSRSDCGDQKGGLIPAFHDANLNDPQVGNIVIPEPESAQSLTEEVSEAKAETEVEAVVPEKNVEEVVEKFDVAQPVDSTVIPDSGKKLTPKVLMALLAILGFIIFLVLRARSKKS